MKKLVLLFIILSGIFTDAFSQLNRQARPALQAQFNQVAVPPLIGKTLSTAIQLIDSLGLNQGNITEMQANQPAGTVIRQFPAAGQRVNRGTSVNLYVSGRQAANTVKNTPTKDLQTVRETRIPANMFQIQQVTVPPLVGRNFSIEEITAILTKARLRLGTALPVVDNDRINLVVSQEPATRQRVLPQSLVNITYGIAEAPAAPGLPENVVVPNYIGMDLGSVFNRLPNDRLTQGPSDEIPSERPPGEVLEQFPPAGSVVDPNTPLALKFSSGLIPEPRIEVPRLIGHSLQEAAEILISKQLYAGYIKQQISDKPEGEVLDQSPTTGTLVNVGSAIDITYSVQVRDENMLMPDVTRMPEDKARYVLAESGLLVEDVYSQKSKEPHGTVISQTPFPGERVIKGTPVILIISENNPTPGWIYWGGGIVAALLLGGFVGWKSGKPKPDPDKAVKNKPEVKFKIIPDTGQQYILGNDSNEQIHGLNLKIIPDKGIQTIKSD